MISLISGEWKVSFQEGKHFVVLRGAELAEFKELLRVDPSHGFTRVANLMLLFEIGVNKVAVKSGKPAAEKLVDFIAEEVIPQLVRDGRYDPERTVDETGHMVARRATRLPWPSLEAAEARHMVAQAKLRRAVMKKTDPAHGTTQRIGGQSLSQVRTIITSDPAARRYTVHAP